jgi:hypothetical protein
VVVALSRNQPFARNRGAGDVAAQPFEFVVLVLPAAHPGMQAEAVRIGAQATGDLLVRLSPVRKPSTFCPARGPNAIRDVREATWSDANG